METERKWSATDVATAPLRCLGPRRTIKEALAWLRARHAEAERTIQAAQKRLLGEPLTRVEERLAEDVTDEQIAKWNARQGRLGELIEAVESAAPNAALRPLARDHGLPHLIKGIRNKGCGLDLRATIAELLESGEMKEDGVEVAYACPKCGAQHSAFRTPPAPVTPAD